MSSSEAASSTLRYLESKLTDAEIERCQRLRFLQDCKAKGFKDLEAKGLIKVKRKREPVPQAEASEVKRIAKEADRLVNHELVSIPKVAKQFGLTPPTLKKYCDAHGITLMRYADAVLIKDRQLINKVEPLLLKGENLTSIERILELSDGRIYNSMKRLNLYIDGNQIKEANEK